MKEIRYVYRILAGKLKRRDGFEELGVEEDWHCLREIERILDSSGSE
jgi:hypothetical protein